MTVFVDPNDYVEHYFNNDICYEILQYLEFYEIIGKFSLVCKRWNEISRSYKISIKVDQNMLSNLVDVLEENQQVNYYNINEIIFTFTNALRESKYLLTIEKFLPNLTSLDMWGNEIEDKGITCICKLQELKSLNVGANYISPLGLEIIGKYFKNLTCLDISCNSIDDYEMKKGIQWLKKLVRLNISYCGISRVQFLSNMNDLQSLNISGNNIDDYSVEIISNLGNLTELEMEATCLKENQIHYLSKLKNLTFLAISNNEIGNVGCKHISELSNLTKLLVNYCNIQLDGFQCLVSSLKNLTSLEMDNNLKGNIIPIVEMMKNMKFLSIQCSALGLTGVQHISTLQNLTLLNISDNMVGTESMGQTICNLKNLNSLIYSKNTLSIDDVYSISKLTNLTTLAIENTKTTDEFIEIFCISLPNLITLHANENSISSLGARLICNSFLKLENLYLSENSIGDDGLKYISNLKYLTSLGICNCGIGDEGVSYLPHCRRLKELLIMYNDDITAMGSSLISSMKQLNSIHWD